MKLMILTLAGITLASAAQAQGVRPGSVAPRAMQTLTPALAEYTDEVLFGDVWRRPDLAPRDRSLVTVSVLVATGKVAQLEGHLGRALDNGVRPSEISGLVTHLAFYSGWPSAVSSLEVVERVFRTRGVDASAVRASTSQLAVPASEAARSAMVARDVAPVAPKLAELTDRVLFADLWRRTDLAARDRSLITIAVLAAGGDADQLSFHVRRGLENGLTRPEIAEAITHLAFYAGWPKAMAAMAVAGRVGVDPAQSAPAAGQGASLQVVPAGSSPTRGPASRFTGVVTVTSPFRGTGGARLRGGTVTFEPGARSNWHIHPLGQLFVVTAGQGLVQDEGGPVRAIRVGDTVWTAPGVKHWHGASPSAAMAHVAVSEAVEGEDVRWLEPVTDRSYRARAISAGPVG